MKKGTLIFSGILTLIFSVFLLAISVLMLGVKLNLDFITNLLNVDFLAKTVAVCSLIFITPVASFLPDNADLIGTILVGLLVAYSVFSLVSSIVQLANTKKEEEKLVKAKKLSKVADIFRIIFCVFILLFIILSFVKEDVKNASSTVASELNFEYINLIVSVALLILGVLSFVLPMVAYKNVGKNAGEQNMQGQNAQGQYVGNAQDGNYAGQYVGSEYQGGQYNYDAPMGRQDQYYAYNDTQPINPNDLINDQTQQGGMFNLVPGQDGIPQNITQKGLEDLARLERLRASGAIDDRNYYALKQKICSTNLG